MDRLIEFQNKAETDWQQKKSVATFFPYLLAILIFIGSSFYATLRLPFTLLRSASKKQTGDGTIKLMKSDMHDDLLEQHEFILLDFWAAWCGPCIMMEKALQEFASSERRVQVCKVNADLSADLVKKYAVKGLPQLILLKHGLEIQRHAGPLSHNELLQKFGNPQ